MHTEFFGDGEHSFPLTPDLILELERTTGHGIGSLFNRISTREFAFFDLLETVRLGLIGGGLTPQESHALINTYGLHRPIGETAKIALEILVRLFFGTADQADQIEAVE